METIQDKSPKTQWKLTYALLLCMAASGFADEGWDTGVIGVNPSGEAVVVGDQKGEQRILTTPGVDNNSKPYVMPAESPSNPGCGGLASTYYKHLPSNFSAVDTVTIGAVLLNPAEEMGANIDLIYQSASSGDYLQQNIITGLAAVAPTVCWSSPTPGSVCFQGPYNMSGALQSGCTSTTRPCPPNTPLDNVAKVSGTIHAKGGSCTYALPNQWASYY